MSTHILTSEMEAKGKMFLVEVWNSIFEEELESRELNNPPQIIERSNLVDEIGTMLLNAMANDLGASEVSSLEQEEENSVWSYCQYALS